MTAITIDHRYAGPPGWGNGGYVSGRLAAHVGDDAVTVTLLRPTPMGKELRIEQGLSGEVLLLDGTEVVATAKLSENDISVPESLSLGHDLTTTPPDAHPFPGCFVCGPACRHGLHIYPRKISDGFCAAQWTPEVEFADESGKVRPEIVWAALDCPGAFAALDGTLDRPIVLGRFSVRIGDRPRPGETLTVASWSNARQGRKHEVTTAIYNANGRLLAASSAIWIELQQQAAA